ncbi:MAG: TIGR04551 family protein, partial [Chloroflexota bacterium]
MYSSPLTRRRRLALAGMLAGLLLGCSSLLPGSGSQATRSVMYAQQTQLAETVTALPQPLTAATPGAATPGAATPGAATPGA